MAAWKDPFTKGIKSFRAGDHECAIQSFSKALDLGGDSATVCDARAAVYQRMGKLKEALRDSKTVIDSQPDRWQGYARSARLFLQIRKFDAAMRMVELALERVPSDQADRSNGLRILRDEISAAREEATQTAAKIASLRAYHFGKLPVEIATTMFSKLLEEDHAYVVTLAQVCQNWRATILDMPTFWSKLVLGDKHPRRKVRLWKDRSRNRIRDLVFLKDFTDAPSVLEELRMLSVKHLQTLRVENFPVFRLYQHLHTIADEIVRPFLGCHMQLHASLRGELLLEEKGPSFRCKDLRLSAAPPHIVWSQLSDCLRHLESCSLVSCLGPHDWHHLLWLLHRNPSLSQLEIGAFLPTNYDPIPDRDVPPIIALPKLSALQMTSSVPDRLIPLLALPSLTSLQFAACPQPLASSLRHLADGPASTLTSLSIHRATFNPQLMMNVLSVATGLESLRLTSIGDGATTAVLEALARPLHDPPSTGDTTSQPRSTNVYCPALRYLDCSDNPDVKGGPLVRLVRLRLTEAESTPSTDGDEVAVTDTVLVRPIEALIVDKCPALDPEILPWLRQKVPSVSCIYLSKKAAGWKR